MVVADPKPSPEQPARRPRFAAIQAKLERILHTDNRALSGYRVEVVSILEALDGINRDTRVMRTRGHLGDTELD